MEITLNKWIGVMSKKFRISARHKKNNLEVNLAGDFDGTSAFELIQVLNKKNRGYSKAIVNTDSLKKV